MQSAAEACFKAIATYFSGNLSGKKAQVLGGQGNNGGDGAALALELSRSGRLGATDEPHPRHGHVGPHRHGSGIFGTIF